jgi:cytidylate kinase
MSTPPERTVVTVDGLGASGKSSLAQRLAERLGFGHLNSGLLYRAVAFSAFEAKVSLEDEAAISELVAKVPVGLLYDESHGTTVTLAGVPRDVDLTGEDISLGASQVGRYSAVRSALLAAQRKAFAPGGVVAEGRDMGTVVFPEAPVKFFVIASLDVRAERRFRQLQAKGSSVSLEEIKRELSERDERDATRPIAPTKPANGAVIIDNSSNGVEETVDRMLAEIRRYLPLHPISQ